MNSCPCEDSKGVVCGRVMTDEEVRQDGMCQHCADNVWAEMRSTENIHKWTHEEDV